MLRGVAPDVQPGVGLFNSLNGLYNDDGDVFRRGGSSYFSGVVSTPLSFVWSGYLGSASKILIGSPAQCYGVTGPVIIPPVVPVALGGLGLIAPVLPAIVANKIFLPNARYWDGGAAMAVWEVPAWLPAGTVHLCAAAGRLLVARGNRVAFSAPNEPQNFTPDDYHDLPGGVLIMGMTAIRDTAFVFTNYGLYTISNLAFDLTDSLGNIQQQLQLITPELSLWNESALASWRGVIVAPCMDRIYLVDGLSTPVSISDSIQSVYMAYVQSGHYAGGAKVYRNHYYLPIIEPVTRNVVALLVCRLNRPVQGRSLYYPWTIITGYAAQMVAADFSLVAGRPRMISAHRDGRLVDVSDFMDPAESQVDADESVYPFDVETRDFATGRGQPNHVRAVRLRYTAQGNGRVLAGISLGTQSQRYEDIDSATYAGLLAEYIDYAEVYRGHVAASGLPPTAGDPERYWYTLGLTDLDNPGVEPISWPMPLARRTRFARVRFRTEDAVQLNVHHVDLSIRQASHDR